MAQGIIAWRPAPKDTGHSCIFDFPDGPINPIAPPPVPSDPPDCYPYCQSDDWPPIIPPGPPDPPDDVPPNAIPHGFGTVTGFNQLMNGVVAQTGAQDLTATLQHDIVDSTSNLIGLLQDFDFATPRHDYQYITDSSNRISILEGYTYDANLITFPFGPPYLRNTRVDSPLLFSLYILPEFFHIRWICTQIQTINPAYTRTQSEVGVTFTILPIYGLPKRKITYDSIFGLNNRNYTAEYHVYLWRTGYVASNALLNGSPLAPVITYPP